MDAEINSKLEPKYLHERDNRFKWSSHGSCNICSEELKERYIHEALDQIVSSLNGIGHHAYKTLGRVPIRVYLSDSPDGGGDIYADKRVFHIREITGMKTYLHFIKRDIKRPLVMIEAESDYIWKVHILKELSNYIDMVIKPPMFEFSSKTGNGFKIPLEERIVYKK